MAGRREAQPHQSTGGYSWDDFSGMLNPVEQVFSSLLNAQRQKFAKAGIEADLVRERWGGLDIQLHWNHDGINRGISAEIDAEAFKASPPRFELPVIAAAMKTESSRPYGQVIKRRQEEVGRFALPLDEASQANLKDVVYKAYIQVTGWNETDLEPVKPN